ncbi:uncharacterized protein H6S33_007035 [Morchella sextelata]|uniref:uncharacterized protein n=1 Tax=Morchella sextelata TaxID=1174677 RepID=UPI001D04F4DB|nr:uncharacterized protein H6S33_007035 [Morchella sextelata]KAH0604004.1 hypothetical protein H6S33_007035 [Morchella sextelata]
MSDRDMCLPVGLIGWSQDSVSGSFGNGQDIRIAIEALRSLTNDQRRAVIATYDPLRVVEFRDQGWITLDNRLLYIFRALLLPETSISVRLATTEEAKEFRKKLTTEGATIVLRSNRHS